MSIDNAIITMGKAAFAMVGALGGVLQLALAGLLRPLRLLASSLLPATNAEPPNGSLAAPVDALVTEADLQADGAPGFTCRAAATYLLVVASLALLAIMQRLDSALQQMHLDDGRSASALGFPVAFGNLDESIQEGSASKAVGEILTSWQAYDNEVAQDGPLRSAFDVAGSVVQLDFGFLALYLVLGLLLLRALYRLNNGAVAPPGITARETALWKGQRNRHGRMVISSGVSLVLLGLVDFAENVALRQAFAVEHDATTTFDGEHLWAVYGLAVGPTLSLLKLGLSAAVIVPALIVLVLWLVQTPALRTAVSSARGILYAVAALAVLMSIGIGAAQLDDVVRAWDGPRAVFAVAACVVLSGTIAGATRRLTTRGMEHPAPDMGKTAQPLLLGSGVLLILIGVLLSLTTWGWGLTVAGGLLVGLWALGLASDRLPEWTDQDAATLPGRLAQSAAVAGGVLVVLLIWEFGKASPLYLLIGAVAGPYVVLVGLAAWILRTRSDGAADGGVDPVPPAPVAQETVVRWGEQLAKLAGAAVTVLLVTVIARATALDAFGNKVVVWDILREPMWVAVTVAAWGLFLSGYRPKGMVPRLWTSLWTAFTGLALAGGIVLFQDSFAVAGAEAAGSVAVLLGGFTVVIGVVGLLVTATRRGPASQYQLAPALRAVGLRRFPVVSFLVAWLLVVSLIDKGGYHDVRREPPGAITSAVAPTLDEAWNQFASGSPGNTARPVVIVAAQGGGVRAAVWTSLVMECLFGPGPVPGTKTCAKGSGEPNVSGLAESAKVPVPVFLASGASGGSVGIAAWSARRADFVQDGTASGSPAKIEQVLSKDFVAPDIARLVTSDLPHALLAWDKADRAEMLERSWERAWRAGDDDEPLPHRGMSRGLRELWNTTHQGDKWLSPLIALNGVGVEDDCRFLASAVDFALPTTLDRPPPVAGVANNGSARGSTKDGPDDAACRGPVRPEDSRDFVDVLPSTNELIDYLCPNEDVPLSTAAHISARFPFVSPTGRIERKACGAGVEDEGLVSTGSVSFDADGGLFDNSGAGTAADAWRALQPLAAQLERAMPRPSPENGPRGCFVPIFVQIDNSPPKPTRATQTDQRPAELFAPAMATLKQIGSREAYARAGAAAAFTRAVSVTGIPVLDKTGTAPTSLWFRITLFGQPGPEPPLGWTLAPETVSSMRSQLAAKQNAEEIAKIVELLKPNGLQCKDPQTPR